MNEWKQYRRKQIAELRPYVPGEDLSWGKVSISAEDLKAGSPKPGDMIARNPKNHADQWLVAAAYFAENFEPIPATPEPSEPPCACPALRARRGSCVRGLPLWWGSLCVQ
jgi:hypothetical protein